MSTTYCTLSTLTHSRRHIYHTLCSSSLVLHITLRFLSVPLFRLQFSISLSSRFSRSFYDVTMHVTPLVYYSHMLSSLCICCHKSDFILPYHLLYYCNYFIYCELYF